MSKAFQKVNPDVQISVTQIPYNSVIDQLTVRFASGRPPGVFELPSENFGLFASQGWLLGRVDGLA